jgi:hypothetical protein
MKLQHPTYVRDIDLDAHIRVFKKTIKTNGEIVEINIINLLSFTIIDSIFEWGEIFVEDHPNCTFKKLEEGFCKWFEIVKNGEEVYMQLQNIQQQIAKRVEVYYECLLKVANFLHVRATNVYFVTFFLTSLLPYLLLVTIGMK